MHRIVRYFSLVFAVLSGLLLGGSAFAQGNETRVIVPDLPGGAIVSGCYRSTGRIYGKYRIEFCLQQRGTYFVSGGGVLCDGRLDWTGRGAEVRVQLRRTSCGNGVAWSADTMTCRPNLLLGLLGLIVSPDRPFLSSLTCNYTPVAGRDGPTRFTARRTN
ncbi:hypothetical protein [Devosia sp. 2618]|uniref:hypothetical protein n=1 Tax=Devosia sp. 2618 TaxID=3156454 RepID=UPI00339B8F62